MTKFIMPAAAVAAIGLSSCAVLGPYSYDVYSELVMPQGQLSQQSKVISVPAPLDSVCHLQTTRKTSKRFGCQA